MNKLSLVLALFLLLACQEKNPQVKIPNTNKTWHVISADQKQILQSQNQLGHPILLSFWATWCSSCQLEMPILQDLYREFAGQGLQWIPIDLDTKPQAVLPYYLERHPLPVPVFLPSTSLDSAIGIPSEMPTLILIDAKGRIVQKWTGAQTLQELREALKPFLP